jgi:hypothetical protein
MGGKLGRKFAAVVIALSAVSTLAVMAQPTGASDTSIYKFNYNVDASTHLKTLDQTIVIKGGTFVGGIDFDTLTQYAPLKGWISLPTTTFTYHAAGIVPLIVATAKVVPTKAVTGSLDLSNLTVTATATFNLRIVNAHATGTTVNLVGDQCVTATPVVVTMSGTASFGTPSVFSGEFTLPQLKNCGAGTTALNLVLPGPGNTFTATATPK